MFGSFEAVKGDVTDDIDSFRQPCDKNTIVTKRRLMRNTIAKKMVTKPNKNTQIDHKAKTKQEQTKQECEYAVGQG